MGVRGPRLRRHDDGGDRENLCGQTELGVRPQASGRIVTIARRVQGQAPAEGRVQRAAGQDRRANRPLGLPGREDVGRPGPQGHLPGRCPGRGAQRQGDMRRHTPGGVPVQDNCAHVHRGASLAVGHHRHAVPVGRENRSAGPRELPQRRAVLHHPSGGRLLLLTTAEWRRLKHPPTPPPVVRRLQFLYCSQILYHYYCYYLACTRR